MKTVKWLLLGLCMLTNPFLFAIDTENFPKIEEMHNNKWQFMVAQAQLSPDDIQKVQPVFMEYEKTIWQLHQANRDAFKTAMKDKLKVKPNFSQLNDLYVDFELKQAQLFKNYHLQLRKLLVPETLFKYYKAEREFKRKLLQGFQDRRKPEGAHDQ